MVELQESYNKIQSQVAGIQSAVQSFNSYHVQVFAQFSFMMLQDAGSLAVLHTKLKADSLTQTARQSREAYYLNGILDQLCFPFVSGAPGGGVIAGVASGTILISPILDPGTDGRSICATGARVDADADLGVATGWSQAAQIAEIMLAKYDQAMKQWAWVDNNSDALQARLSAIKVQIATLLPMTQDLVGASGGYVVGEAGRFSNIILTVGTDADHDGLPDAWERELIAYLDDPRYATISDINPNDDADGDGVSNMNEFLAGTFAFLRDDFLRIENYGASASLFGLGFLSVPGKAYSVAQSTNLASGTWTCPPYVQSTNGLWQPGPFGGDGDWMQVYVPRTNGFRALRLQVSP